MRELQQQAFCHLLISLPQNSWPCILPLIEPNTNCLAFRTYGDYYYTLHGFLLTLLGTALAALKTVVTNILQAPQLPYTRRRTASWEKEKDLLSSLRSDRSPQCSQIQNTRGQDHATEIKLIPPIPKLHLTPVQLLHLLSPLALFQCILLAIYFGETTKFLLYLNHFTYSPTHSTKSGNHTSFRRVELSIDAAPNDIGIDFSDVHITDAGFGELSLAGTFGLLTNVFMAFALNIVSLHTNRTVGPLGMSVAGTC